MDNVFWLSIILTFFLIGAIWFVIANETKALAADTAQSASRSCPQCGADAPDEITTCECGYAFTTSAPAATEIEAASTRADPVDIAAWRLWGLVLILGGVAGFGVALMMSTTVAAYGAASILGGGSSEVVNLGLLFNKGVAIAASLAAIGLGVFCLGVSAIVASLRARS